MKYRGLPLGMALLQGAAFAATRGAGTGGDDILSQIVSGFSDIISGSMGLKIAVIIIAVIALAIGWWRGSAGW